MCAAILERLCHSFGCREITAADRCFCNEFNVSSHRVHLTMSMRAILGRAAALRSSAAAPAQRARPLQRLFSSDERDVEVKKTEKEFVALLRRIADAVEADKSFRIQVDNVRLTVPETAKVSVEHEQEGDEHCVELQFKWTKP